MRNDPTPPENAGAANEHGSSVSGPVATSPPTPPPGKRVGSWLLAIGAIVVLGVVAVVRFQLIPLGPAKGPATVENRPLVVRYVLAMSLQASQRSPGPVYIAEVRGDNELNLSFEVGGALDQIGPSKDKNWDLGATVSKGTVLAQLRPDDFTNRIKAARARADLAKVTHERLKNLVKTEAVAQQKLDQATTELKTAEADLAGAEQSLKESVLRAPEDGTILDRMVNVAEIVGPGRPVLRFSNLRRMSVEVGVPDTALGQVHVGQDIPVVFSAMAGQAFTGTVAQVAVAGDEGSRLFKVKIKVPNPDGKIKSGMTASVSFARPDRVPADSVWVPLAALVAPPGAAGTDPLAVYVVDAAGKAQRRVVQTDEIAGNLIMITRGVKAGDKVVVTGVGTLHDGAAVDARASQESFR